MKYSLPNIILNLARSIQSFGGRALLVGGCVRDLLSDSVPKDFDIEVYGIEPEKLHEIASTFGEVIDAGKTFGILKLRSVIGDIDLGIPRSDSKVDAGHKGFAVHVDPAMTPEEAARRRDFTVNAIMMDPLTEEVIDPFHGVVDLEQKILRVVDAKLFSDDPLRVLRAMQFVARFNLTPDAESMDVMRKSVPSLRELSQERLRDEWRKLLVLAERPSIGLQLGFDLGVFNVMFPELPPLKSTPQNPEWHPEGDVWIHTLMVVDEEAALIRRENCDEETAFMMMLVALCHDFGKSIVTAEIDGKIRAIGHEPADEAPARSFLARIGVAHAMVEKIVGMVKHHMAPTVLYLDSQKPGQIITDGAIRRLAASISPATIQELLLLAEADYFGRGQFVHLSSGASKSEVGWRHGEAREFPERPWLLDRASKLDVLHGPASHAMTGEELVALGIEPGVKMGELIREADRLRDDEGKTKEEILEWINQEKRWM